MVERSSKGEKKKRRRRYDDDTSSSPSSSPSISTSSDDDDIDTSSKHRKRSHRRRDGGSRREREERRRREKRKKKEKRERERRRRRSKGKRKVSESESESESEDLKSRVLAEDVIREILTEFPGVSGDIEQLLRMIDGGQAVDINGLSERSLVKHLKKLFLSLNLKENGNNIFLLPPHAAPTLEVVLPMIKSEQQQPHRSVSPKGGSSAAPGSNGEEILDDSVAMACPQEDIPGPKRRVIGPAMPSAELLAAAAKLTEAEAELREIEVDEDTDLFIGPPPPAMVTEAASVNEAERFEEVTRIMGAEVDSPYDVVGVNRNMSADNIKKRYWKLSLMVHPDKCTHPEAHQAFIRLNKAFKDLQDPDKRKALDDKIKLKEEQEEFKAGLKAMREAAQWRRLQGISMEGDDVLLAEIDMKVEPKRDEWMTTLPPERKPGGMPTHTTNFSRNSKEGRGDTSVWTDTPSDRAQKAKMNYLEAYNEASALMSKEEEKKRRNSDAELVDEYNKAKRSKSLVEKHQEITRSGSSLKKKAKEVTAKQEWEGQHPWKPWDREKDLTAGRKSVNFDSKDMSQGLSSRFSSGSFQRSFL